MKEDLTRYKLDVKKPSVAILTPLIATPAIGAVIFTPGLPAIMREMGISTAESQLTMTLYLIGYAVGQILYGPVSNRFGRKPSIYIGMVITIFGALLAGFSGFIPSFTLLLVSRFIMAIGASSALVLVFTIINDYFYQREARKIVPYVALAFSSFPFISSMIGGYLVRFLNWESTFFVFALYSLCMIVCAGFLPETALTLDPKAFHWSHIKSKYRAGFKSLDLICYSIIAGCTTSMIYIFSAAGPLIIIRQLHFSPDQFGVFTVIVSIGNILGTLFSAKISKHLAARKTIQLGMLIMGCSILALDILFFTKLINIYTVIIPFFILFFGTPIAYTNATVLATTRFHDKSTASAIMTFIYMAITCCSVLLISFFNVSILISTPVVVTSVMLFMILFFAVSKRILLEE